MDSNSFQHRATKVLWSSLFSLPNNTIFKAMTHVHELGKSNSSSTRSLIFAYFSIGLEVTY